VKSITIEMGIHRELHLDSVRNKPYTESEIARIEAFAEELMNEKITSKNYIMGVPYDMERINSSVYAMASEPIAYSLLALDKMKKRVADVTKLYADASMEVIVPSKKTQESLLSYRIFKKINVIPTGLELDRFNPALKSAEKTEEIRSRAVAWCKVARANGQLVFSWK
jgi:hypothetical protein